MREKRVDSLTVIEQKEPFCSKTGACMQTGDRTLWMSCCYHCYVANVFVDFHQYNVVAPVQHGRLVRVNGKYEYTVCTQAYTRGPTINDRWFKGGYVSAEFRRYEFRARPRDERPSCIIDARPPPASRRLRELVFYRATRRKTFVINGFIVLDENMCAVFRFVSYFFLFFFFVSFFLNHRSDEI